MPPVGLGGSEKGAFIATAACVRTGPPNGPVPTANILTRRGYGLPCQEAGGPFHGKRLELWWADLCLLDGFRELRAKRCCQYKIKSWPREGEIF